jgi:hypothetical protein
MNRLHVMALGALLIATACAETESSSAGSSAAALPAPTCRGDGLQAAGPAVAPCPPPLQEMAQPWAYGAPRLSSLSARHKHGRMGSGN